MRIERDSYKGRRSDNACLRTGLGCGLMLALALGLMSVGFLVLLPRLPELVLRASGFQALGQTSDFVASAPTSLPLPRLSNSQPLRSSPSLQADSSLPAFNLGDSGLQISQAQSSDGTIIQVSASEDDLRRLYQQSIAPELRGDPSMDFIDLNSPSFDLYNGGIIVRAELSVPQAGIRQNLGIVLQFSAENQVRLAGLDVNGTLLTPGLATGSETQEELLALVAELEQALNRSLRDFYLDVDGQSYRLWRISANAETLTLLLR